MEKTPRISSATRRLAEALLKIAVTLLCIWYVSGRIDLARAGTALEKAKWPYLFPALLAFIISKMIAAVRLNIFFRDIRIDLSQGETIRLYWLGMFYNLFLPGSISGDAYKVILLTKKFGVPYRDTTAAVLLDRFSGLLGLGLLLALYSFMVPLPAAYPGGLTAAAGLSLPAFYFILKKYFPKFAPGFRPGLLLGILVQLAQVICIYLLMAALDVPASTTAFIFLFLVSSAVSVLPLTIGGLGIRELVFLKGAAYFGMVAETAVLISLLFYLVNLLASAWGGIYIFKRPLNEKGPSDEPLIF
ncbi:MAG: flippase-like domain-containing protein [Sphingobacteriales bacterium]|nr:flippase-like domain-containing protein [Sphingobacteriales bacterium]